MNKLFFIVCLLFSVSVKSQNWDSIRGGKLSNYVERVLYDSVHNKLLVSGKNINKIGSLPVRGIMSWDGTKWDSLAGGINTHDKTFNPNNPNGTIYSCIPYNGKLLAGGIFQSVGGIYTQCLGLWDGNKWDSLPKRAFRAGSGNAAVVGFLKFNSKLYIYGQFDSIAKQPTQSMGYWDGVNFNPIILPVNNVLAVNSLIVFQNELYVGGTFFHTTMTDPKNQILKWNGTSWVSVGGGIPGVVSRIYSMAIYNNELYVAGRFFKADGNAGEHIQKWDGSQWRDVGFGGEPSGAVWKLIVFHNKLWALGSYQISAYIPSYCLSVYDGNKWCALQDSVDNGITGADIYNDTLYIGGGFQNIVGLPNVKYLAKIKNENLYGQCKTVGINELVSNENQIKIYPNPVSNKLQIETEQNEFENSEIEITNTLGQTVLKLHYSNEIDVSKITQGFYQLKISTRNKKLYYSKFIKE